MYYKFRDMESLTASLLYRMSPDLRKILNNVALLLVNIPEVMVYQDLALVPRIPTRSEEIQSLEVFYFNAL